MVRHKKEFLVTATVSAIALPLVWCILVLLYEELPRRSKPELLYKVLMLPVYPVRTLVPFLDITGSSLDIAHVVSVLLFLICIGFCLGFILLWLIRYIRDEEQDCNE